MDETQYLPIRLGEGGGFRGCAGTALDLLHHSDHELHRFVIGLRRAVDELGDDRLALGDLARPAGLGDDNRLVQRLTQQSFQILGAGGPTSLRASGVAMGKDGALYISADDSEKIWRVAKR